MLNRLVKIIVDRKIFCWDRKNLEIKVLAVLIYYAGISYRKVRDIFECIEPFSHEALRKWYSKLKVLFVHEKKHRRAIAVDETKVKLENRWVYIWNAIDVDNREVIAIHVSTTRTSLNALYFLRKVQTFGERNAVEQWYSLFKARVKRFWKGFPYHIVH